MIGQEAIRCARHYAPEYGMEIVEEIRYSQGAADLTKEETASLRSHQERKESFYTILVSGVDDGNGGSDTNILLAVDAAGGSIFGVSIPRDTKAQVNGKKDRKSVV